MMNKAVSPSLMENECPGMDVLKNFEMGDLNDSDSAIVAEHLADCEKCGASIQTINLEGDTLVSLLRSAEEPNVAQDDPHVKRLESFAKLLVCGTGIEEDLSSGSPSGSNRSSLNREGTTLGAYLLKEMIGQGGMGTVYKAQHRKLKRSVALKIISADCATPSAIKRFYREMKAVGKLDDHPHLVKATDAGEENGTHFLAMEFIEGENLSRFVKRNGPLEIADACEAVRQTALGLRYVHENGLTHRDIKPANLMLSERGTIKLLDLGLARLHEDSLSDSDEKDLTGTNQIMGTVDYMSPEQIDHTCELDTRSDIYSLGCTFYFLLTGKPPFSDHEAHASLFQKMRAHTEQEPPHIQTVREDISDDLAAIVHRCLSKNPSQRFQTAIELIEALEPFCKDQQLVALSRQTDQTFILNREVVFHSSVAETQLLPKTKTESRSLRHRPALLIILSMLAASILAAFGGVIVLYTGDGTLEITVNEPDVKVTIDGKDQNLIHIESKDDKVTIKLDVKSGKHKMTVTKNGFESETKEFRMIRGGKILVSAILKPKHLHETLAVNELKRYLGHEGEVRVIDLSPDGKRFVSGGEDGNVRLWEVETGRLLKTIAGAHTGAIWDLSFSPDGNSVLSGGVDQRIRQWNLKSGRMLGEFTRHHKIVAAIDFSEDGKSFVSGGWDGNMFRYETKTPNSAEKVGYSNPDSMLVELGSDKGENLDGHIRPVRVMKYDGDGEKFLSAGNDPVIFVWDRKGKRIAARLIGHGQAVTDAVFSPDGKKLLSGSYDRSVRYWEIESEQQLLKMVGHSAVVHAVAISPDGKYGISGGGDATIRLWNLETGKQLHTYDLFHRGRSNGKNGRQVVTEMNTILCLAFLPDGKRFLSACKDGSVRMWKLPKK